MGVNCIDPSLFSKDAWINYNYDSSVAVVWLLITFINVRSFSTYSIANACSILYLASLSMEDV